MIKEALQYLKESFQERKIYQKVAGREFIAGVGGDWKEVRPSVQLPQAFHNQDAGPLQLGSIESLGEFINQHTDRKCQVMASKGQARAYFDIDKEYAEADFISACLTVSVPFIKPTEKMSFNYVQFMDFLDQHSDRIKDFDALAAAVRSFRTTDVNTLRVSEKGPAIVIESAASKDIEGATVNIPKEIQITMPMGTYEYMIPLTYLLRITTDGGLIFKLTKKENDDSWRMLINLVLADLRGLCPKAFIIEGAE